MAKTTLVVPETTETPNEEGNLPLNPKEPTEPPKPRADVPDQEYIALFDVSQKFANFLEVEKFEKKKDHTVITILLKGLKEMFGPEQGSRKRLENVKIYDFNDPEAIRGALLLASGRIKK